MGAGGWLFWAGVIDVLSRRCTRLPEQHPPRGLFAG